MSLHSCASLDQLEQQILDEDVADRGVARTPSPVRQRLFELEILGEVPQPVSEHKPAVAKSLLKTESRTP